MEFKEKLKKMRGERGLSQQALADAIFVSRSAVAKWEAGLGMPCEESMRALEAHFGVARDFFLTDKPDEVIVKKNIRTVKVTAVFGGLLFVMLMVFSVLLMASVMCSSYGLTSKMAAGKYFYDNPCIHNADYDIYYGTMDILWGEGVEEEKISEYISTFRPVRKLWIGYGVFEEDYMTREVYQGDKYVGVLYSIQGKDGYYNILMRKTNVFPTDLLIFESVVSDGEVCEVQLNSFFETKEVPETLVVGETTLTVRAEEVPRAELCAG